MRNYKRTLATSLTWATIAITRSAFCSHTCTQNTRTMLFNMFCIKRFKTFPLDFLMCIIKPLLLRGDFIGLSHIEHALIKRILNNCLYMKRTYILDFEPLMRTTNCSRAIVLTICQNCLHISKTIYWNIWGFF